MLTTEFACTPFDRESVSRCCRVHAFPRDRGYLGSDAVTRQMRDDVRPCYLAGAYLSAGYLARHHSSISFAAEFSQLIILRSGLPVCSIWAVFASARSRSKFGRPASSSATHSRANSPAWMSASSLAIASLVPWPITRGPRVRSPYSAVSLTE